MSAEQQEQPKPPTDPGVGLNPTGRQRRSSAATRRKKDRRKDGAA